MHFIFTLKYIAFYSILHAGKHIFSGGEFREKIFYRRCASPRVTARVTFSWKSRGEKCALFEKVTTRRKFHELRHSLYHHAKHEITLIYVHPLARSTRCILSFFTKKIRQFSSIFDCVWNVSLFPRARRALCAHIRFSSKIQHKYISFLHLNTLLFTLFCTTENTLFRGDNFMKKCFVSAVRRCVPPHVSFFENMFSSQTTFTSTAHTTYIHCTCSVYALYPYTPWHVRIDSIDCIYRQYYVW